MLFVSRCRLLLLALSGILLDPGVSAAQASFERLPIDRPSLFDSSHPTGASALSLSADGRAVVGMQEERPQMSPRTGVRWDAELGISELAELPIEGPSAFRGDHFALGLTPDGSTIVGSGDAGTFDTRAIIWNADGSITSLAGDLPTGESSALDISADGKVVLGQHTSPFPSADPTGAFLWDATDGARFLEALTGESDSITGVALSDDGLGVAGTIKNPTGPFDEEAFRWTESGGLERVGFLSGHSRSEAFGISADGSTIVGESVQGGVIQTEAYRWSAENGIEGLGQFTYERVFPAGLPTATATSTRTRALASSENGEVIVGAGESGSFANEAGWIYSEALGGMISIRELLIQLGIVGLDELQLGEVTDISADGKTVVGWGRDLSDDGGGPGFNNFAWRAVIPEPGTATLFGLGLIGLARPIRLRPSDEMQKDRNGERFFCSADSSPRLRRP